MSRDLQNNENTSGAPSVSDSSSLRSECEYAAPATGFLIVGIGASAGGLAAFETFFRSFPKDASVSMAFVLVQHLAPDHKSGLVELVRSYTDMQVFEIEESMPVRPSCIYVIPPNHELAIFNGTLQLLQLTEPRNHRLPIDYFFSSLAHDQNQLAIGLIFSGSGSDGSRGVCAIKNFGGMVMVQSPESAEFDGMPQAAIKTGIVDIISPISEMPGQLLAYASQINRLGPASHRSRRASETESAIQKIFMLIRARTGHDFTHYKPSTIDRRIERRMAVNLVGSLEDYVIKLQQVPAEIDLLFQDLLIGVTSFFRDPEAFEKLEQTVLPKLVLEKSSVGAPLRVWVCGCSTGEEAYSLAILIHEQLEAASALTEASINIQIFASDIDARAIATARTGLYPISIKENVTAKRLARYFTFEAENSAYRIHKKIRDMVIFSEHDVNKDPPFSKLDLISCRNLMIYLGGELQHKLIPLFHFALQANGFLFLGSSEGIGDFEQLFSVVDRHAKLYRRKPDYDGMPRAKWQRSTTMAAFPVDVAQGRIAPTTPVRTSMKSVAEQAVLGLIEPKAALIDAKGNILYLLGRTGSFLEPASGEPGVHNIFKMAREGLRQPLSTTLHKVVATQRTETLLNLPVRSNGHFTRFNLTVSPVSVDQIKNTNISEEKLYVVLLAESSSSHVDQSVAPASELLPATSIADHLARDAEQLIASLSSQLQAKEEYLQSAYEELETANEELKSSNEEMQSVNEELQSTNEELETSKEELQSINEELATVNTELQNKVADLSRLNNDMNNLLSGSGIATIFVDTKLCVLRFTPSMSQIINLINSDVGRPVGHIVSNLVGYDRLVADLQKVLDTLESQERRVQSTSGLWFQMRIRPYRTIENVIEGVVITFVDVTEMKRAEDSLEKANRQLRLAAVVRDASDAITVHDLEGRIIGWNPSASRIYGWSEEEALTLNIRQRVPAPLQRECMAQVAKLSQAETLDPFQTQRLTKSGQVLSVRITATALLNESGVVYAIATYERAEASP